MCPGSGFEFCRAGRLTVQLGTMGHNLRAGSLVLISPCVS